VQTGFHQPMYRLVGTLTCWVQRPDSVKALRQAQHLVKSAGALAASGSTEKAHWSYVVVGTH
jgi:hypothetical protein